MARYKLPYGAEVFVNKGGMVADAELLFEWDPFSDAILASVGGIVHYVDIKEDQTFTNMVDEATSIRHKVIRCNPRIAN